MSTPRPWILAEADWKHVRETPYTVAVLPWGATEAHNYHLPYGTDNYQVEWVAAESARRAWAAGARVAVLPAAPFGVNTGQLDIKLVINMNPSTQLCLLRDVADALDRQGIRKLVVMNGHGGNDFKQMLRELAPQFPRLFLCALNWYGVVDQRPYFEDLGDHAGEMETSAMLAIRPDLVRPLSEAGDGAERRFRIRGLRERWVWAQRAWSKATADTGIGSPAAATAAKGAAYLEETAAHIAAFLVELAAADPDDLYER